MKAGTGVTASIAAIAGSVATMACCLPIGLAAGAVVYGISAFFWKLRPWLLMLSVVLIAIGFWQQRRAKVCAVRSRWVGQALLWTALGLVLVMTLFPQQIAGFIADHLFR